ncbi:MAG: beta-propeller fold lactonase family protein, partial [Steroidobacteraceae bacterium]|nr:beta-propeller fold lactonase family protein [Steroidobacteraceae bacterium]
GGARATPLRKARFVYALSRNPTGVVGYRVDPDTGALTLFTSTPVTAGNEPGTLRADPAGRFLFVGNRTSNDISVFSINGSTGVLTPVGGSPFGSGGQDPHDLAVHPSGQSLYVANRDSNTVAGFRIDPATGALSVIPGATVTGIPQPKGLAVDPAGRLLFVAATPQASSPIASILRVYRIDPITGALIDASTPSFTSDCNAPPLRISHSGRYLYGTAPRLTGAYICGARIDANGTLTHLTADPVRAIANVTLTSDLAIHPTDLFAFAAGDEIVGFGLSVTDGVPSPLRLGPPLSPGGPASSVLAPDSHQVGWLAIDPSGSLLYGAAQIGSNLLSRGVRVYTIDSSIGTLQEISGSPFMAPSAENLYRIVAVR